MTLLMFPCTTSSGMVLDGHTEPWPQMHTTVLTGSGAELGGAGQHVRQAEGVALWAESCDLVQVKTAGTDDAWACLVLLLGIARGSGHVP